MVHIIAHIIGFFITWFLFGFFAYLIEKRPKDKIYILVLILAGPISFESVLAKKAVDWFNKKINKKQ